MLSSSTASVTSVASVNCSTVHGSPLHRLDGSRMVNSVAAVTSAISSSVTSCVIFSFFVSFLVGPTSSTSTKTVTGQRKRIAKARHSKRAVLFMPGSSISISISGVKVVVVVVVKTGIGGKKSSGALDNKDHLLCISAKVGRSFSLLLK